MADNTMVEAVIVQMEDHFHELDDSEEAPFGEFARIMESDPDNGYMVLWHETEDRGVRIKVELWTP